jgi:hypothetical protein
LATHIHKRITKLIDTALGEVSKDVNLALALATSRTDDLALLLLDSLQSSLEALFLDLGTLDLGLEAHNVILNLLLLTTSIDKEILLLSQSSSHRLLALLFLLPPLLANFLAAVLTLLSANAGPFVTTIATLLVVADSIVDALERNIRGLVALVLAVESGEGEGDVQIAISGSICNYLWRVA